MGREESMEWVWGGGGVLKVERNVLEGGDDFSVLLDEDSVLYPYPDQGTSQFQAFINDKTVREGMILRRCK